MIFEIFFTPTAKDMLADINQPFRKTVLKRIKGLKENPESQGIALVGPLRGMRRIKVAGRYRVIYRVNRHEVQVIILSSGPRKAGAKDDIYELTKKLVRLGLVGAYY